MLTSSFSDFECKLLTGLVVKETGIHSLFAYLTLGLMRTIA